MSMILLPPSRDACPICATPHGPGDPHNAQSLYYQYRFHTAHGRWPTWADAVAHCLPTTREAWRRALQERVAWSEPSVGDPIADPPAESFHQVVDMGEGDRPITVRIAE